MTTTTEKRQDRSREEELDELEQTLGYVFNDPRLLDRALTHRSFANETLGVRYDNQRLEFLGDAVLGVVIAEALFREDERAPEGTLSSQSSVLVCEPALVERALDIHLGDYLLLGHGEELTGGRTKDALLADAYEAVLGAIFLDGGHGAVRKVILEKFAQAIDDVVNGVAQASKKSPGDFKSLLQRTVQSRRATRPHYRIVDTSGPPHKRIFIAEVLVEEKVLGRGEGTSKKTAEQAAASEAIRLLESLEGDWEDLGDDSLAQD